MMIFWFTRKTPSRTAADLETGDLVDQIRAARGILYSLRGKSDEVSQYNPAYMAWSEYEFGLACAAMVCSLELTTNRLVAERTFFDFKHVCDDIRLECPEAAFYDLPDWCQDEAVIRSHRSNLARRKPGIYESKWTALDERWPYIWPIPTADGYDLKLSTADKKLLRSGERQLPKSILSRLS